MKAIALLMALVVSGIGVGFAAEPEVVALTADGDRSAGLATDLENVRLALGIPGMSAAVVEDGQMVWAAGFGFADLENQVAADPHTPFGLASVTKPIAATLVMQLVAAGTIDLDAPVSSYGVDLPNGDRVTVRHLLTHTSEGTPGTVHEYNGNRYAYLGGVIEGATGQTFSKLLGERVLVPLGMMDTALNPINSWGGASVAGLEEFGRSLGWGEPFDHYPDVYDRLARPYQFNDDYSIIPGMYHLSHSPAAGGISSVADLAKFDIALDSGALLDEASLATMLAPTVATVAGRDDLNYGLGWYVQDFEGLRLVWHTGRWPPSTSALYLRVPELDLTFIVLANTDNLTVPFPGIGSGDLSHSLPALTFLHHYVLPRQYGVEIPAVDWWAGNDVLVDQLSAAEDGDVAALLERELWSYRQAFASSGQFDRADALAAVASRAFPGSRMRNDERFTHTVGKMPIEAPIPSASSFAMVTKLVMAWLLIVAVSLLWMAFRVLPPRDGSWWATAIWLLATLLVGPVALIIHHRVRKRGEDEPVSQIVCASLFCVAGYGAVWLISIWLLLQGGEEPNPLLTLGATIVLPAVVGLLLIRSPLLVRSGIRRFRAASRRGVVAEVITWSVGLAVFFSLTFYVDERWLSTIPYPSSPYFGAMMSLLAVVGFLAFLPLHWLLHRRGFTVWPSPGGAQESAVTVSLPTLRDSWWMLLASLAIMVAVIALAVSAFGS